MIIFAVIFSITNINSSDMLSCQCYVLQLILMVVFNVSEVITDNVQSSVTLKCFFTPYFLLQGTLDNRRCKAKNNWCFHLLSQINECDQLYKSGTPNDGVLFNGGTLIISNMLYKHRFIES